MGPFPARPKRSAYTGSDVVGGSEDDSTMADKIGKKEGMNYCVAGGPNKVNCSNRTGTQGISKTKHSPTTFRAKSSCLCSAHFDDSCLKHKPGFRDAGTGEAVELRKLQCRGHGL